MHAGGRFNREFLFGFFNDSRPFFLSQWLVGAVFEGIYLLALIVIPYPAFERCERARGGALQGLLQRSGFDGGFGNPKGRFHEY